MRGKPSNRFLSERLECVSEHCLDGTKAKWVKLAAKRLRDLIVAESEIVFLQELLREAKKNKSKTKHDNNLRINTP